MQAGACLLTLTAALSQALPQMQDRNVLIACFGTWSSWCRPMPRVCGKRWPARSGDRRAADDAAAQPEALERDTARHPPHPALLQPGMTRAGSSGRDIQDVLGHVSDKMARHYAGEARKFAAASLMTEYSLAGQTNRFI